uniref:Uncharacterized protein n=1 Tax=Strongyloides papillosus TaxID=174720 RepID=A0A0N5B507_STREA
MSEFFPLFFC